MPVTPGGDVTDPNDLPKVHQQTRLALEYMTDHAAFQNLCDMILSEKWGYRIHPRGVSARGTVRGQPDSWGEDREGRATAFCYGTNKDWRRKIWEDLADVAAQEGDGVKPNIVIFGTNRHINADVERDLRQEVREKYGWELRLFGQGELAIALDTEHQHLRRQFLNIALERHTWRSLLAACADQRAGVLARYAGKYEPTLYVPRRAEAIVATVYRDAVTAIARGEPHAQLVPLVDQAGAGKSTLMLRLAEMYGARGPVVILPGSQRLVDEHSFEREIVNAVGYPQDGRTYQANLHELCDIARRAGYPLMVILEAVNEGRDLALARSAVLQLLTAHRDSSLLVVMTCRDSVWHHLRNHTLRTFVPSNVLPGGSSTEFAVPIGQYDDEESRAALDRYFARWQITGYVGGNAAHLLRLPLLLSIFAEVNQGRNIGHLRTLSSSDLWRQYEARKIDDIYEALGRSLRKSAIAGAIEHIAQMMLERGTPVLEVSDVSDVPHLDPQSESPESLFVQLKNAGILLEDPVETIRFAHEPFAEFVLGRILAEQLDRVEQRVVALDRAEQLVRGERWRNVVIHAATLAMDPGPLLTRLRSANLWWATRALLALDGLVPADVRAEIVRDLGYQLTSAYALDRRRAADALGRLGANESADKLRANWDSSHDAAALRALARLGVEDIAEDLVLNLGRAHRFYWPELQEFVDSLCKPFRDFALHEAIRLLGEPDQAKAAATALGYLRDDRAVGPLTTYLESADWADTDALLALLRIGSQGALAALERAIVALGESISRAGETQSHESGITEVT